MALTAKGRADLPKKDFAGAGKSFPIENKSHARAAISGASRSEHAGNISKTQEASIDAKAEAKLDDGRGKMASAKHGKDSKHHVNYG